MQLEQITLDDINLMDVGNSLQIGGIILTGQQDTILLTLPNDEVTSPRVLSLGKEDFKKVIRQMDLQEAEICQKDGAKIILRKSQRQLDQMVSWEVFRRDNYTCCYCGRNDVPLTYDHVKLWEDGGENTVENGVSACKKCNKTRGNTDFEEWIFSGYVLKRVGNVPIGIRNYLEDLAGEYKSFPSRVSKRSR